MELKNSIAPTYIDLLRAEAEVIKATEALEELKRKMKYARAMAKCRGIVDDQDVDKYFDITIEEIKRAMVSSKISQAKVVLTNDRDVSVPSVSSIVIASEVMRRLDKYGFRVVGRHECYRGEHSDPNGVNIVIDISWQ
jgi:hypothetical protein